MRLGFIGIGDIACHHAKAARAAGASIVACCASRGMQSPNLSKFLNVANGLPGGVLDQLMVTNKITDVLDWPAVDGVVVAPSWQAIPPMLPTLLRSGKPLLVEKPVALRADDLQVAVGHLPMASDSFMAVRHLRVGFNRRFYEPVQALRARLARGGLRYARVVISEHLEHHMKTTGAAVLPWLLQFTSIHTFDLVGYLFGELRVEAGWHDIGNPDFMCFNGLLAGTTPLMFHVNADAAEPAGIWCHFNDGSVWALSPLETLRVYQGIDIEQATLDRPYRQFTPKEMLRVDVDRSHKPGFMCQMRSFLNGHTDTSAGLVDAWNALRLIEGLGEKGQ